MVGIPLGNILRQVTGNADHAILEPLGHPEKGHAPVGKAPEIDRLAAIGAADGDGHMLAPGGRRLHLPFAEDAEPPDEILAAIGPWRPVMRADRKPDIAARPEKFIGNLRSRRAGPDDQNTAVLQLFRIAVMAGMNLVDDPVRHHRRDHRRLERPGRGDDMVGRHHPVGRLNPEASSGGQARGALDLDATAHRGVDALRHRLEIANDAVACREAVAVAILEFQHGKPVMPGRPVGHEAVPARGAPALCNTVTLDHQMVDPLFRKMRAHRQTGLAATDNDGVHVIRCHDTAPPAWPVRWRATWRVKSQMVPSSASGASGDGGRCALRLFFCTASSIIRSSALNSCARLI